MVDFHGKLVGKYTIPPMDQSWEWLYFMVTQLPQLPLSQGLDRSYLPFQGDRLLLYLLNERLPDDILHQPEMILNLGCMLG